MIINPQLHKKILLFVIAFFLMCLPIGGILVSWLIIAWLVVAFAGFKKSWLSQKLNVIPIILLIGFYIIHAISLLYSKNLSSGLFDLQVKASILIFPLLVFSLKSFTINDKNKLFRLFIFSCLAICFFSIIRASYRTLTISENPLEYFKSIGAPLFHFFYYSEFIFFHHPTYFSMYILLSITIIFNFVLNKVEYNFKLFKNCLFIEILFLIFVLFLVSSKAGIISFIAIVLLFCTIVISKVKKAKTVVFSIGGLITLILIFIFANPRFIDGIKEVKNTFLKPKTETSGQTINFQLESVNNRLIIWNYSLDIAKENFWFGIGAGDIKDELIKTYKKHNLSDAANLKFNVHNQYLETLIGQGIFGLIWLLLLLLWPLILSIKRKNILGIGFITILSINFMFESMLNTQAGVVFFAFFYCFLFITEPKKDIEQPSPQNPV